MGSSSNPKEASSRKSGEASSVFTIYCHIHRESGRRYVGQTRKTWKQRWNQHVYTAEKLAKKGWSHFANAIRKYGKDAFSHEVLETCATVDLANVAEEKWIAHFNTRDPLFGFNIKKGGDHVPHPMDREYWNRPGFREAASARSKAVWADPQKRFNILTETRAALQCLDVRAKLSKSVTELWKDPEFRSKNLAAAAKSRTPEVLEKLRRNWDDPLFRDRCSVGTRARSEAEASKTHCLRGHPRTPENLDAQRECKACIHDRRVEARASCPKGHPYVEGSFKLTPRGRRDCLTCRDASKGPRPCTKCGREKKRRSGGRLRCGPCTDARTAAWEARRA